MMVQLSFETVGMVLFLVANLVNLLIIGIMLGLGAGDSAQPLQRPSGASPRKP